MEGHAPRPRSPTRWTWGNSFGRHSGVPSLTELVLLQEKGTHLRHTLD